MMKLSTTIKFNVEPADRSVGIMSEGFSAWDESSPGEEWVNLDQWDIEFGKCKFTWENGKPSNARLVERALWAYAHAFYEMDL
jgi:hypothetical protein